MIFLYVRLHSYHLLPRGQQLTSAFAFITFALTHSLTHSLNIHQQINQINFASDLNAAFPSPRLPEGTDATDAATSGLFPAMAKFIKNKDEAADAALRADLEAKLAVLDAHLAGVAEATAGSNNGGGGGGDDDDGDDGVAAAAAAADDDDDDDDDHYNDYSATAPLFMGGGSVIGLVDCALAPKLFHLRVAAAHFKAPPFVVDPALYPALARYMAGIFQHPAFLQSVVPDETVIWGWGTYH